MNSDKYKNENFELKSIFRGIKDWRIRYECIENGCSRLDSLSVKHLGCWKELEGNQQVELKYGYKAILDSMINKTDSEKFYSKLKLKHSLSRILLCENSFNDEKSANDSCEHCLYTNDENKVVLLVENNSENIVFICNHVICTMSLGYLKENLVVVVVVVYRNCNRLF